MKKYELTGETKIAQGVILKRIRAVRDFGDVHAGDTGGWIEKRENLSHDGGAWVCGDAQVSGNAQVCGNARVCGDAQVSGNAQVCGNARVCGGARVCGNALVCGGAQVCGDAQVSGNAQVSSNAQVSGNAQVYGNAQVCGNAWVCGDARVCGNARVYGDARVCGNARVCGDARVCGGRWEKSPCCIHGTRWSICVSSPVTVQCGCQNHTWQEWHDNYAEISECHGGNDVLEEYIRYFNLLCEMYGHEDCKISYKEQGEEAGHE